MDRAVGRRAAGFGSVAVAAEARRTSEADLRRATWALAWPVIFTFSIESFVGLCDMLMVGRLGPRAVAAVGVGVQILGAVDAALFARHGDARDRRATHRSRGTARCRGDTPS